MKKSILKKDEKAGHSPFPPSVQAKPKLELSFPEAIGALNGGKKIRRLEWADKNEYVLLKDSFLMIHRIKAGETVPGFHTFLVSEGDLLAIDWVVINDGN